MEDWKKEVQRLLDTATEETVRLVSNMKHVIEENKDKINADVVKEKVTDASEAVAKVWKSTSERLNEFANDPKVGEYRAMFKDAYQKASKSIVDAYDSLKDNQELKEKLQDASEFVKETADKLVEKVSDVYKDVVNEEKVQDVVEKLKEVTDKGVEAVKEKMSDPKVQETVGRIKDGANDVAEKATEQLKKLFKKG